MKRINSSRGITLIELLLVMSVFVVLMVVNVAWIHQTMKFSALTTQRQRHHKNLTRLAWELRDDVRQSNSLSMDGDDRLVLEQNDGAKVTYTIAEPVLVVERRSGEKMIQRVTFDLAPNSIVDWDASEMPEWVSLIVVRGGEGLAKQKLSKKPGRPSAATDSAPVDLHVRVRPNRWKTTLVNESAENGEDSK